MLSIHKCIFVKKKHIKSCFERNYTLSEVKYSLDQKFGGLHNVGTVSYHYNKLKNAGKQPVATVLATEFAKPSAAKKIVVAQPTPTKKAAFLVDFTIDSEQMIVVVPEGVTVIVSGNKVIFKK